MDREELEAKAKELGLEVSEDISDEDLEKTIKEKEDKIEDEKTDREKHLESEAKKAYDARDKVKKERNTLKDKLKANEKEIEELRAKLDDIPSKDEFKELKKFKEDEEKRKEEEELAQKSELERTQIKFKKQMEEFQKDVDSKFDNYKDKLAKKDEELEKKDKDIESLRVHRLKSEIIEAATSGENKARNPDQVFRILKDDYEYDKDSDEFIYPIYKKGKLDDYKSVEEHVHEYLGKEENDNLVLSDVNTDSMYTRTDSQTKTQKKKKKLDEDDPVMKHLKIQADRQGKDLDKYIEEQAGEMGFEIDTYLEIQAKKVDKLADIEQRREKEDNR